nr:MAG: polyprotein [Eriocheir sinensis marnavirus 3]
MAKLKSQRERELIGKSFKRWKDSPKMQSGIESALLSVADKIPNPEVCSIAEDVLLLTYDLIRATSVLDYTIAAISFAKRRTSGALLHKALSGSIASFVASIITTDDLHVMQSGVEEKLGDARDAIKMWPRMKASPLWRKVNTVVVYATSLTLFGKDVNKQKAIQIEENYYKSRHMARADFVYNVLDLLLFIAERGIQVVKTSSLDPMFHSGGSYEKWYDDAMDVIAKSKFLSNPKAHGIDIHNFTTMLDNLILQGQSMSKYACELDKSAKGVIRGTVGQLLMVRATHLNRRVAQQTRRAPIAFVLEGHSSVAKTTFANILHYYYGALQKKNVEAGARYTRMSTAAFWDGFSSDQWSLLIDDAASIKPGVIKDIDPSIREILQVVNNAPFSPDMAAIEEKGAAPFLGELVVVTTNTPDLNLNHYFNAPGAVARRLPFHIRIAPKKEWKKNATMINEAILPELEVGSYPDWWDITILEPKLVATSEDIAQEFKQTFELFPTQEFTSMERFLHWYRDVVRHHVAIQDKIAIGEQSLRTTKLCPECEIPKGMCVCMPYMNPRTLTELYELNDVMIGAPQQMQSGWEDATYLAAASHYLLPAPDFAKDMLFFGFGLISQLANWWMFGGLSIWSFVVLPLMLAFAKRHAGFLMLLLSRATKAEVCWHITRTLGLRYYYALYDFVADTSHTVAVTTTVANVAARQIMRRCGDRVAVAFFSLNPTCQLIVAVLTVALAAFGIYTYLNRETNEMQGSTLSTVGQSPLPGHETENVWTKSVYTPSTLDMGRCTLSWKNLPDEQVQSLLAKNCAFVRFRHGDQWKVAKCIALGGQYFMTTNHSLPAFVDGYVDCQLVRGPVITGPTGNVRFKLHKSEVLSDHAKDIAIFRVLCVPPARDITHLFVREKLANFRANGYYLGRTTAGQVFHRDITGIYEAMHYNKTLGAQTRIWWAKCDEPTEQGDCGAILIGKSGQGPIILGLHQLGGGGRTVGAIKVTYEDIKALLGDRLIIDDKPPMLGVEGTTLESPKELHPKSPLNYLEEGTVEGFGSFEGFRANPKFRVEPSIMAPFLMEHGFEHTHIGPQAHGWKPKYEALKELVELNPDVENDVVERCMQAYVDDIMKVDDSWTKELMIYDIHTAVNGVPGLRYVDGIKRNTSAGFPWCAPKQLFLEQLEPTADYPDHVQFNPEIEARVEEMIERYQNDCRASGVFRAAFKDEPLPIEKARRGKVRLFMMASAEMTIIMRMYLLSFVRVAQSNHFVFECAPGMEAQSVEWDFLYQYLTEHGYDMCIFGDFKGYDKTMHPAFILFAFEAIAQFIERKTGDKKWANIIRCIGIDIAFAYVDFFGDLVMLFGKNPSGQALTAIINGIVNSLYMRYVWEKKCMSMGEVTKFSLSNFKANVNLITYGDDNGMNVSKTVPWFNHTSIKDVLATIGVVYTMADKESESVHYVPISEGSFLKRSWRREGTTNTMVGPLEFGSISKMLMVRIPSAVVSAEIQAVDTIRSANSEFFWHGREVFEKYHALMIEMVTHLRLDDNMNPPLEDWNTLMERYIENSAAFLRSRPKPSFATTAHYLLINERVEEMKQQCGSETDVEDPEEELPCGCYAYFEECLYVKYGVEWRPCGLCGRHRGIGPDVGCEHCSGWDRCFNCDHEVESLAHGHCFICREWCHLCDTRTCVRTRVPYDRGDEYSNCEVCGRCMLVSRECEWCILRFTRGDDTTSPSYLENRRGRTIVTPRSSPRLRENQHAVGVWSEAPEPRVTMPRRSSRQETPRVTFWSDSDSDNESTTEIYFENFQLQSGVESGSNTNTGADVQASSAPSTETLQTAVFLDGGIGDTLTFAKPNPERFTHDAQTNVPLGDFLSRPKLIKTVTWTPGVLSASTFNPWTLYLNNTEIKYKLNNYAYFRGNLRVKVVLNAAPFYYGALMMYYTPMRADVMGLSSTVGVQIQESQRPHIWLLPQNNEGGEILLPFFFHKNFVNISLASEVARLGDLTLKPFTDLASANGAVSNGVQMQIYAWLEDVRLFGPTIKLAMQSGDEYGNGPVSAPATAVAHWATYLSRVPMIGRLAKATSLGANAVSQIAMLFGWSNVPVIENVRPVKNTPFHDLASAHISEPTSKFMLDPKGELSVDPAIVGIGAEDEMSIAHIVQKESYLATGTWTAGSAAGALIFSSRITPALGYKGAATAAGTKTVTMTPMAWASIPFAHWRGDIIFKFKVICSKFHSGRLRIHWDPIGNLSSGTDYTHVTYTKILDLQESDEVEFRVPYMQALAWLGIDSVISTDDPYSTTVVQTTNSNANGSLTVRVLNNLTAPVDTAVCPVLIFVRGAENLEFANPKDIPKGVTLFGMQSGTEPCPSNSPSDERYLINWGEAIPSIRVLLRRSTLVDRITAPIVSAVDEVGFWRTYQTRLPPPPGYDIDAFTNAVGTEDPGFQFGFSYTAMTALAWYASAFVALRGSTRWHYNMVNAEGKLASNISVIRRVGGNFGSANSGLESIYVSGANNTSTSQSLIKGRAWNAYGGTYGTSGMAITNPQTQTGVSVELPYMSNYLFQFANPQTWLTGADDDGSRTDTYILEAEIHPAAGPGNFSRAQIHRYVSAGTDFTLHYFLNTPVVNYNTNMGSVPI